ncbi:MAG: nicotinate (nicotinamide) nucleotide adenylyltransferase [Solirubrobacterales bacterium]
MFGSAFNPPQLAHLKVVEESRQQLGLDLVLIVPTGEAYHKQPDSNPGREVRFRMAEAAFSSSEGTIVCRFEIDREGPSFTYVTLEQIEQENPDSELYLLMGADTARDFAGWKRPERILELARAAVVPRPGVKDEEVLRVFEDLSGSERLCLLEMSEAGVSSSEIRERIASGLPVEDLVPTAVVEIIKNEEIYGSEH